MKLAHVVPVAAFLALAAVFAVGLVTKPQAEGALEVVRPLPAFALPGLTEDAPGFSKADLAGQVALVNVFASWCPSCVIEHPTLTAIAESGAAPVYGVAWQDAPGAAAAWLARYGDPYTATGDDPKGRLGLDLGVTGAPETFVIDRVGRIRHRHVGPISPEVWERELAPLIEDLRREPGV